MTKKQKIIRAKVGLLELAKKGTSRCKAFVTGFLAERGIKADTSMM
jgi:hypothetical protein